MPKERLHLLLAEKSRSNLPAGLQWEPNRTRITRAYLLGSICPDLLFYDLPTFSFSKLGNSFHRLQGEAGLPFFRDWLAATGNCLEADQKAWIFGFVNHFLADGLLHPLIEAFSNPPARPCQDLGLTPRWCHHWLESELEAHWLAKSGPADGYLPLLKLLNTEVRRSARYPALFREFLQRAEEHPLPSLARIRSCLVWQTFLLSRFASARWGKRRSRLLATPLGRSLGALIVPLHSRLCTSPDTQDLRDRPLKIFCETQFLEQIVTALASHWRELAEHS